MMDAYIRTVHGETMYLPLRKAVEQFVGASGYRLTLSVDGFEFVIRRAPMLLPHVDVLDQTIVDDCHITIRGL